MLRHVRYTASTLALYIGAAPGLCVHPPPVHTVHPWLHSQTPRKFYNEVRGWHHHHRLHYKQRRVFILGHNLAEWCTEINLPQCCTHPCLHQWNWGGAGKIKLGSWESQSRRINHGHCTSPPFQETHTKGISSYGILGRIRSGVFINFYIEGIESILTGNTRNWHGPCTAQDRKAPQWVHFVVQPFLLEWQSNERWHVTFGKLSLSPTDYSCVNQWGKRVHPAPTYHPLFICCLSPHLFYPTRLLFRMSWAVEALFFLHILRDERKSPI